MMNKPSYYVEAAKWLDDNHPFFLTSVVNIGQPVESNRIPRAAVALKDEKKFDGDYDLELNRDYCSSLPSEQLAGVLCHEAMHILLRHFQDIPKYKNQDALVIAQECIVNDKLTREGIPLPTDLYFGIETLGVDTADMTTREVYDLVLEKFPENELPEGVGSIYEEFIFIDGSLLDDILGDIIKNFVEEGEITDLSQNLLDDIIDAIQDSDEELDDETQKVLDSLKGIDIPSQSKKAGTGFSIVESLAEDIGASIAWAKLLADICPDLLNKNGRMSSQQKASWHRPRRTINSLYPDVMLPTTVYRGEKDLRERDGNKKPHLVLALDFSGSIDRSNLSLMKSLALSVPDDIDVDCCTFSTHYVPYDYKSKSNRTASGGTDFSAIEYFIRSLDKKDYPSAVVVITDGYAQFSSPKPTEQQLDNWLWLALTPNLAENLKRQHFIKNKETVKPLGTYIKKQEKVEV